MKQGGDNIMLWECDNLDSDVGKMDGAKYWATLEDNLFATDLRLGYRFILRTMILNIQPKLQLSGCPTGLCGDL